MERPDSFILVIFGASGDLTKRKLIPALFALYKQNLLSDRFALLGFSRSDLSDTAFRERMTEGIKLYCEKQPEEKILNPFCKNIYYQPLDASNGSEYTKLKTSLFQINAELKTHGNYIYYLSTSPNLFPAITESLGKQNLEKEGNGSSWKRIIIEKPFGHGLESAKELNTALLKIFYEKQIYRIDHYLGKETVQNILAFRFANGIFEPLWNKNFIDHIQFNIAETVGVEGRGGYYDRSGVLRDMIQNHMYQMLAYMCMEPPASFDAP